MRRVLALAAGTAALAAALGSPGSPAAHAALDPGSRYQLYARADAMAIEYLNTAAPVFGENAIIYGTPATAISAVDSVGQSNALAAAPYPGDIMIGMPDNGKGVIAGFGGPAELVPTYPFAVTSSYPIRPDGVQDQSGNRLVAHSDQHASRADARSGLITGDMLAALQAQAASAVAVDDRTGKMTAVASSRLDGFKLTDALQVGKSTAHASLTREPGQAVARASSFTIGSITVNGTSISYSDQGFHAGDQSPPSSEPPAALFEPLKQAGITVEFLPAAGTDTSVQSAGLRISQVQQLGPATQRVSLIIGAVHARIDGEATPAPDGLLDGTLPASDDPSGPTVDGPPPASAEGTAGDGFADGALVGAGPGPTALIGDSGAAAALPDLSSLPPALEAAAGSPTRSAPAPPVDAGRAGGVRLASPAAAIGRGLRDDDVAGFYGALGALAALATLAAFLRPGVAGRSRSAATGRSVLNLPS